MSTESSSASLSLLLADVREGKEGARNMLIARLQERLTRLTAAILSRSFPLVAQRRRVESVVQDLNVAMIEAIDAGLKPESTRKLIAYAAESVRNMLIDDVQKLRRRQDFAPQCGSEGAGGPPERVASEDCVSVLVEWSEFQMQLNNLTDEERVVFDMHFHVKLSQAEIAEELDMSPKAVSRAWLSAANKLKMHLPKFQSPKRVLLVSGGVAYTATAATNLFRTWRAFEMKAVGYADKGQLPTRESLERADVVIVTRPEYADLLRHRCDSYLCGKSLLCANISDTFNPSDSGQVDALWRRFITLIGN